uniref:J domain-containing protein n=1 Tax=viral metagenome TaxID=1070528 RepID=A0A6C0H798_9ZZZZ
METICVDEEYYDPYFILGVTHDDTLDQIKSAFRKRAKRYHPDKASNNSEVAKYELRFKIVVASYEYIKNKRTGQLTNTKKNQTVVKPNFDKETLKHFNEKFVKEDTSPMSFGYGEHKRVESEKDYQELEKNLCIINQFEGKDFSHDEFNRLFEYLKINSTSDETEQNKSLIHKTTDGFYGFNTGDVGDFAQVSSYNGLMVTGDNFGQSGLGYWNNNYGDYRYSYTTVRNPEEVIQVPEEFKSQNAAKKINRKQLNNRVKEYQSKEAVPVKREGYRELNEQFYQKTLHVLMTKQEQDKQMIMQYAKQSYPAETLQQAMAGQLEQSPSLLLALQEHYNCKQIKM